MKAIVAGLGLLALSASASLAGGTCQSHFRECKRIEKSGGVATVPCETRLQACKATKIWTNGVGKEIHVKG